MSKIAALIAAILLAAVVGASDWPQFRGPNCSGLPAKDAPLPGAIGPTNNVLWKTALPPGHSSPIVVGDRIYITGVRQKHLVTIALERKSGKVLWEVEAAAKALEKVHKIGSHAQSTPVADGERVISFFGSAGLFCYDRAGKEIWHRPFGPFQNDFGAASSPILVGDWIILCQDHDQKSFLMALDKRTGDTVWKTDRSDFLRGFCTPVIWDSDGKKQVVVAGTLRVAGYDLKTGKEIWTAWGISRTICASPAVGVDGRLYLSGWAAGGDPGAAIPVDPFDDVIKLRDKNKNGKLERFELDRHPFQERFTQVDTNGDGSITRAEYERFRELFQKGRNAVIAIRPGGKGDVTDTHVVWKNTRQVPFCASVLIHAGLVYTLKTGGIFSCLDPKDGKAIKVGRLPDNGNYYSSPVAGDGKIFVLSERGTVGVIRAGRDWQVLSTSDFDENVYATPAIADGRIYVRTAGFLYCFGLTRGSEAAADWQPITADLIRKEKPGYGKLCGVVVDHRNGDVFIDLSDKGIYRSTDQGKNWRRLGEQFLKGRTEWPGCLMLDPGGKSDKLVTALVYGAPITTSPDLGRTWKSLHPKSSHVDWCAVDWTDPDMKFVLALKHESGGLLLLSRDGGKSFAEIGKGYGPAWIFDNQTAVVAEAKSKTKPQPGLLRTTDGGKTFEACGNYHAQALPRWRAGTLYWVVEDTLITSTDKGKTWQIRSDLKGGRFGPIFGKNEKHLLVLTNAGIVESTDAGQSWSRPVALPKDLKGVSPLTWMEYDPMHDVLYVMKMGSELYKLERKKQ